MPNLADYANPTEDMECEALAQWLRLKKIPFTHIGNESGRGRTAMLRTAKLKRMGQSKGFPDYLIVIPNVYASDGSGMTLTRNTKPGKNGIPRVMDVFSTRTVAIEMKRKKGGKVSPEQKLWLETLNNAGIESTVCKGFDEAKIFIEERIK